MTNIAASSVAPSKPCAMAPLDKKRQAQKVGDDLVKNYGRQKFYTVKQVKDANRRQNIDFDVACWSHAMFNSHSDFDQLHDEAGEACDYVAMKSEMLHAVATSQDSAWLDFDFDLSWLEFPDLDFSLFDVLDF